MPSRIPEWAMKWKRKGTVMQMVGGRCCIYSNRSHREKGKKNPVVERSYIGIVTPEGVLAKADVNIDKGDVHVYEAGFTDFILANAPSELVKRRNGMSEEERKRKQEEIIRRIIILNSPDSYIRREIEDDGCDERTLNVYSRRLQDLLGIAFEELSCLKKVYLLEFRGGLEARSIMGEEQVSVYRKLSIPLPWERKQGSSGKGTSG